MLQNTRKNRKAKQEINHILIFDLAGYQNGQTFPAISINHIQYFEGFAISRSLYYEIVALHMILILRHEPDAESAIKP